MAENGNETKKLTTRQARAVAALMTEKSIKAAAAKAQVGERTLHRWLKTDLNFLLAVNEAELMVLTGLTRRLLMLGENAADALAAVFDDKKATVGHRLRAADVVLSNMLRIREMSDHEGRILMLEKVRADEQDNDQVG